MMTARQIVTELGRHIVGQDEAKRAVAVALRNRYRRAQLSPEARAEVTPHNILMMGPTGVGKTEIARRLAKLVSAPFLKVEATKFTEVGYVGRDVDSIVRDLVEASIRLVREQMEGGVTSSAEAHARERLIDLLCGQKPRKLPTALEQLLGVQPKPREATEAPAEDADGATKRQQVAAQLDAGHLENETVEIEVEEHAPSQALPGTDMSIQDMLGPILPKKRKMRKLSVKEARRILIAEETDKLIDGDAVTTEAIRRAEEDGIVFIDEIDKIAGKGSASGPDVSREGVQRDILPIVEGSTVMTKYGPVKTDYILFIAAGAFHVSSVDDLIPELQGRFPVRVKLLPLTQGDLRRILSATENAITAQQQALLAVDGVSLSFSDEALDEIARVAHVVNDTEEDIGARRLHTVMETLMEDISFDADGTPRDVLVDASFVSQRLGPIVKMKDLRKSII